MFIHGLHVVSEIRDSVADGDASATTEIHLTRVRETGSSIVVTFTADSAASLTVLGSRPCLRAQYCLPHDALESFVQRFPLGSQVASTIIVPETGKSSLTLRRLDKGSATIPEAGFDDLFAPTSVQANATSAEPLALDSRFTHVWTANGRQYEFKPDGAYFVHESLPFTLANNGTRLEWGPMTFDRLSGDPAQVTGHWLSTDGDEDVLLRSDGTYSWHIIGEFPDALGTWAVSDNSINSAELRAYCSTSGDQITYDAVFSGSFVGVFAFSNGDKTLTITFDNSQVVLTRP